MPAPESLIRASCAPLRLDSELIFGIYTLGISFLEKFVEPSLNSTFVAAEALFLWRHS
jgi:hypothetical protein